MEHMAPAKAAGEVAVFPGMIDVIVGVVAAGIVAHPLVVVVDVGCLRVTWLITEGPSVFLRVAFRGAILARVILLCAIVRRMLRSASHRSRAVRRNVTVANITSSAAALLPLALSTRTIG
jgi:hypothetical protein